MTDKETIEELQDRLNAALDSERIYKEQLEALKARVPILGQHCFRAGYTEAKTNPKLTEADVPKKVTTIIGTI